ncbi:MAG: GNAT family N-acetyltransferase, partial [Chloroflexota bacterium]
MCITLEKPRLEWADGYHAMLRASIKHDGDYPYNNTSLALSDFDTFVQELQDEAKGVDLPEGIPRQQTYFIVLDGKIVIGELRYRPSISAPYEQYNGHIGSNLHPSYRGKGYGTVATRLALDIAKADGLSGVQVTVE